MSLLPSETLSLSGMFTLLCVTAEHTTRTLQKVWSEGFQKLRKKIIVGTTVDNSLAFPEIWQLNRNPPMK